MLFSHCTLIVLIEYRLYTYHMHYEFVHSFSLASCSIARFHRLRLLRHSLAAFNVLIRICFWLLFLFFCLFFLAWMLLLLLLLLLVVLVIVVGSALFHRHQILKEAFMSEISPLLTAYASKKFPKFINLFSVVIISTNIESISCDNYAELSIECIVYSRWLVYWFICLNQWTKKSVERKWNKRAYVCECVCVSVWWNVQGEFPINAIEMATTIDSYDSLKLSANIPILNVVRSFFCVFFSVIFFSFSYFSIGADFPFSKGKQLRIFRWYCWFCVDFFFCMNSYRFCF